MAGPTTSPRLSSGETARITRRVALLSVAVAVVLIAAKAWAWLASGSVAMLSSLADSTLDLAASLFTYFAVRYAATPPDGEHRYGHGKAEAFAGLFQAGLVAVSAALILMEASRRIAQPAPVRAGEESLGVMLLSIALTAALIFAQTRALRQTGSVATKGDRAHYASDLTSNVVVMVGIGAGHFLGWTWADAAAGLLVACWLAIGAFEVAREAADHLMDRELPDTDRAQIETLAKSDPAILGVHDLRTRTSGPYIHIQFHADLDPTLTLQQAHEIVVAAEARIRTAYPAADVIIHPDPADAAEPHGHEAFSEGRAAGADH
ncbi:MAG: cation diffusion facilitator family transporter [Alphaproteobacteria bacterium]|nr:cation diffusion facilitator family transporter [Alphaproteobacteria bacterium]